MKNAKETAKPETAVAVKEQTNLSVAQGPPPTFQGLVPSDIVIPKVLLMQGLSELVAQRKAQLGDIVRSTTAEKLGSPETPIDFIPLAFPQSQWVIELKNKKNPQDPGKFEYKKMISRDAKNSGSEWTFWADSNGDEVPKGTPNAIEARRVQRLALYALLPSDIEADYQEKKKIENGEMPDLSKALMPVLIAFRSSSFNAGKEVVSFFTQAASFNTQAWKYQVRLKCSMEQNDKGTFYIFGVDRSKPQPVKKEYLSVVEYWANVVGTQTLQVDESISEEGSVPSGAGQF